MFYDTIQMSLKTLAQDECYPEEICSQFCNFRMSWSVADLPAYNLITPMITFNGDVEKLNPNFYEVFVETEDPFRGLTCLLGFEIANHILAYINGATYSDDGVHFDCDTQFLQIKSHLLDVLVVMPLEHFIIKYVSQKQPIKIKLTINSVFPF